MNSHTAMRVTRIHNSIHQQQTNRAKIIFLNSKIQNFPENKTIQCLKTKISLKYFKKEHNLVRQKKKVSTLCVGLKQTTNNLLCDYKCHTNIYEGIKNNTIFLPFPGGIHVPSPWITALTGRL